MCLDRADRAGVPGHPHGPPVGAGARPPASVSEEPAPAPAPPAGLTQASALLAAASRPLIWAGGGALRAGAGELVDELSIKLAAPVLTTYLGRGLLPADHPCAVPGPVHATEIGALWDEADLVLAVGTDFDGMMTQNWLSPAPPKLVSMNVDDADANKSYVADVTLVGDARAVLEHLAPLVPSRDGLDALRRRLHAIAGQVQEQVPLTIVLVDDRGYGTLRFDQRRAAHEPFGVDLVGPEFVGLARSFGVPACAVEGFGRAFEDELRRCVADGRRHMIVVRAALKPPPTTSPRWYRRT